MAVKVREVEEMRRVAAIYDAHGNLPALEAVLEEVRRADVDGVVVGGDVVPGPMPRETLERLLELEVSARFIQGNGETAVLAAASGDDLGHLPEPVREAVRWTAGRLDREHLGLIAEWPKTVRLEVEGLGEVLFCHATPRDENEVFTRATPEKRLLPVFRGLDVGVVVCGHTHMPFDRRVGEVRVVNAGSVGLPFGEPGACWLLLGPDVELRRKPYDLERAARRIRGTADPQASQFAQDLLQPRSERETLELFSRVELG